jgi:hypothetical protein
MVETLEKVFDRVEKLPEDVQTNLAVFWNQELEEEFGFDEKLTNTADRLSDLVNEAIEEYRSGNTIQKGIDEL